MRASLCAVVLLSVAVAADRYHPEHRQRLMRMRSAPALTRDEISPNFWHEEARAAIERRLRRQQNNNVARNVIMFLGDGMSIPTLAAARTLRGQRENRTGEETQMFFESFPTVGLSKTYCLDAQIADSACTATAYLCGIKNNYGTTGVTGDVARYDCPASTDPSTHVQSIAEWALADGRDAGIVTTTRITHASPSGTYAKTANRNWENDAKVRENNYNPLICPDIAHQLVHYSPGNQFKVILGGGWREFIHTNQTDPNNQRGLRTDGRNLIEEWKNDKAARGVTYEYASNRDELMNAGQLLPDYLLGLFETSHLEYHMLANATKQPTLAEMTEVAIRSLSRNEKGFFLFVEGGRIDHAHHNNYVELSLDETLQMDLAVEKAMELLGDDDTLIVVTADHAHVMAINGYTHRGGDILGPSDDLGDDGVPYMTLSYTNGPGARTPVNNTRVNVKNEADFRQHPKWKAHAEVLLEDETHGGDDVAVFAIGPHHHMFTGVYEQSQIPHIMAYAGCFGPGLRAAGCSSEGLQRLSLAAPQRPLASAVYAIAIMLVLHELRF